VAGYAAGEDGGLREPVCWNIMLVFSRRPNGQRYLPSDSAGAIGPRLTRKLPRMPSLISRAWAGRLGLVLALGLRLGLAFALGLDLGRAPAPVHDGASGGNPSRAGHHTPKGQQTVADMRGRKSLVQTAER